MEPILSDTEIDEIRKEIYYVCNKINIKYILEKSIKDNCSESQYKLAKFYMKEKNNEKQAFYWYKKSAEQGHINAQYKVADCYAIGKGVEFNLNEAVSWCIKAALQNHKVAQFQLGRLYEEGRLGTVNISNAIIWYTKSSAQGFRDAQYYLGKFYEEGRLGLPNMDKAIELYRLSGEQNFEPAQFRLAKYYASIGKVDETVTWYTRSADNNNIESQYILGLLYQKIANMERDHKEEKLEIKIILS